MAISNTVAFSRQQGHDVNLIPYGSALLPRARNDMLKVVRPDSDFVLFVDDDMLPEHTALERLLSRNLPVVSALCTTRKYPPALAARIYDEESHQYLALKTVNLEKVTTALYAVGAAFLLVRKDVLDKVIEYHLSAKDWIDENVELLNLLHVRATQRENYRQRLERVRRARYKADQHLTIWDFPVGIDALRLGEDVCFCSKLRRLGIPVSIDGTTQVGHIGEYPFGVWDILAQEGEEAVPLPNPKLQVVPKDGHFSPWRKNQ